LREAEKQHAGRQFALILIATVAETAFCSAHEDAPVGDGKSLKLSRKWRTHQDSNLGPLPSEGSALSS
jgi:hypothetical protein